MNQNKIDFYLKKKYKTGNKFNYIPVDILKLIMYYYDNEIEEINENTFIFHFIYKEECEFCELNEVEIKPYKKHFKKTILEKNIFELNLIKRYNKNKNFKENNTYKYNKNKVIKYKKILKKLIKNNSLKKEIEEIKKYFSYEFNDEEYNIFMKNKIIKIFKYCEMETINFNELLDIIKNYF